MVKKKSRDNVVKIKKMTKNKRGEGVKHILKKNIIINTKYVHV